MVGVWGAGVRAGMSFMDAEHGQLIGVLIALEERAVLGDLVACAGLLGEVRRTLDAHVAHENDLMSEHDYPGARAHVAQHALFSHRLGVLYEDPALVWDPYRVVEFFQGWWALHVLDHDRPLARWLANKGLVPA